MFVNPNRNMKYSVIAETGAQCLNKITLVACDFRCRPVTNQRYVPCIRSEFCNCARERSEPTGKQHDLVRSKAARFSPIQIEVSLKSRRITQLLKLENIKII